LNQPSREAFIAAVTDGLTPPPGYFGMNVAMNKKGYTSFDEVLSNGMQALTAEALEAIVNNEDALVLDVREAADFAKGFIPRSVNIGLKGDFAPWVGAIVMDVNQPLVLVCNEGDEEEAITRLSRVGFDKVLGYLKGGIHAWMQAHKEIDTVNRIEAEEFANIYKAENLEVIDVRKESEYSTEHVLHAHSRPLAYINEWFSSVGKEPFLLHCQGGYRSMIAASILKARGIHNFKEVDGGYKAISATKVAKTSNN
jgi:rhodanese-related sulfurtransferase